jgi:hypothetical protein
MPVGAIGAIGAIGSLAAARGQARAASDAARSQTRAANEDVALQRETRDLIRDDLSGYRRGGADANAAYLFEMGLGPRPTFGGAAPKIESFTPGQGWADMGGAPGFSNALGRPINYNGNGIPPSFGGGGGVVAPGAPAPGSDATGGIGMTDILNSMMLGGGLRRNPGGGRAEATPGSAAAPTQFRVGNRTFNTLQEAQAYADANRTGGQAYGGFQRSRDYLFGLREGTNAVEASAAARGGLFSGATMRDLNTFGQDYGSQRRGEYLNRLAGLAQGGLSAAQMSGNASMGAAGNISNALSAQGNAAAAGAIGRSNAWSDGLGNALGSWNYMRQPAGGGGGGVNGNGSWANPIFGGPGLGGFV